MTERYVAYDRFADVYNRHWGDFADRVIEPLCRLGLDQLRPGDRLLDVCCGTGQLAATLSERGLEVIGVDGSEAMNALVRISAPKASFVVDDAVGTVKLTMFAGSDDLWRRTELVLTQRCYSEGDVVGALKMSGFTEVQIIDAGDLISGWQSGRSFFSAVVPASP